jgi:hypothetical protein
MFDWLNENREWVFSGLGISLAALIVGLMRYVWLKARSRFLGPTLPANKRLRAEQLIIGKWVGEVVETEKTAGTQYQYAVTWDFYKSSKHILCRSTASTVIDEVPYVDQFELVVRVLDNRFFMIDFYNSNVEQLNFGSEIIELLDSGRDFVGRFVSYAPNSQNIIAGTIVGRRA